MNAKERKALAAQFSFTPKNKRAPSPLDMLSDAYENHRGLRLSPSEVQLLVQSDNALQSLIEEWSK